jgi:hypothetical protein
VPVYPGVKIVLVGLGAAGREGNASAETGAFALFTATEGVARASIGEGRVLDETDEAHGVCPGLAPIRLEDADADRGGKGVFDDAPAQLAFLLTAERDDCAVELFSLSTLEPPRDARLPLSDDTVAPGNDG